MISYKSPGGSSSVTALLFICLFVIVYGFKILFVFDLIPLLSLLLILALILLPLKMPIRPFLVPVVLLCALLIYSIFISIVNLEVDLHMIARLIRVIINLIGCMVLGSLYLKYYGESAIKMLLCHLFWVIALHSLLMLAMFLIPVLREFIYDITDARNIVNRVTPFVLGYRISGLTYGLSNTSVLQAAGLLFVNYAFLQFDFFKKVIAFLAFILVFLSVFISGRSGLLMILIAVSILFLYSFFSFFKKLLMGRVTNKSIMVVIIGSLLYWMLHVVFSAATSSFEFDALDYTAVHAGEVLTAITNPEESRTVRALGNMYFLPDSQSIFYFGAATLDREILGIKTDVGWIRTWFSLGIIGVVFHIIIIFSILLASAKSQRLDRQAVYILYFLVLFSVVMHFKENFIFSRNYWSITVLLAYVLAVFPSYKVQARHN